VGAAYLLLAALVVWALRSRDGVTSAAPQRTAQPVSLRELPWRDQRLWLVCAAYALIYAFITSQQLHFHASQTDAGRTPEEASSILGIQLLVGAVGAPLFGWLAERLSACTALLLAVAGLAATSVFLWSPHEYHLTVAWAVAYGLVNSGVVALLALVLAELFGNERIGRLMGVAMVFCMGATMLGNLYSASMFDRLHTYRPVWQTYTGMMLLALLPVTVLWARRPVGRTSPQA
jgi:MFS family permease